MTATARGLHSIVFREIGSWWNKYVRNEIGVWDAIYRRDYARKLDSPEAMV